MNTKVIDLGGWGYSAKTFKAPGHDVNYLMAHLSVSLKLSLSKYTETIWVVTMSNDKLLVQIL